MRRPWMLIGFVALTCSCTSGRDALAKTLDTDPEGKAAPEEQVVRALMRAFNDHDVPAMLDQLAEDVDWLAVDGSEIVTEVSGLEAMSSAMDEYFASFPTVRSELLTVESLGRFVTTHERAHWSSDGEERSQASVAVYEVQARAVRRVWYFPAVREEVTPER